METITIPRHRCPSCRKPVPPEARCICEMGADFETLDKALAEVQAAIPCPDAPVVTRTLLQRDWPAIAIVALVLLSLVIGVQYLRLQSCGEAELRSWSPSESVTVFDWDDRKRGEVADTGKVSR